MKTLLKKITSKITLKLIAVLFGIFVIPSIVYGAISGYNYFQKNYIEDETKILGDIDKPQKETSNAILLESAVSDLKENKKIERGSQTTLEQPSPTPEGSAQEPQPTPITTPNPISQPSTTPIQESNLPDLIIESITFKPYQFPTPPPGEPRMVIAFSDKVLEFTVKVKNIGDASLSQEFYLQNTRSNEDFNIEHYSHSELVNQQRTVLNPNETMEVKIIDFIDLDVDKVRFRIATDGNACLRIEEEERDYSNNSYEEILERDYSINCAENIEERDYSNNSYELQIK